MTTVRVWNITDDVRTDVVPHTRMVLGKVIKPGRSVLVDAVRLEGATKVHKEVKAGHLHIGEKLPAGYVKQKRPPRAVADARRIDDKGHVTGEKVVVAQGHGQFPAEAIAVNGGKKVELVLTDEVKVEDKVETAVAMEEPKAEETNEESGRSRRHRR